MKVKVLLTGINAYPVSVGELFGCVRDMHNLEALLKQLYGGHEVEFRYLYDKAATYNAYAAGREWLALGAPDVAIDLYSGHGTTITDTNRDETEHPFDQAIVPVSGQLIEDDRNGYWASLMPANTLLIQYRDACFATGGERFVNNALYTPAYRNRSVKYERLGCMQKAKTQYLSTKVPAYTPKANHIFIATSQDDKTAADALINGEYQGAGTWAILKSISEGLDYQGVIERANTQLQIKGYPQRCAAWAGDSALLSKPMFK